MNYFITILILFLLNISSTKSQDVYFSQFKTNLINNNPAFAGYQKCAVVSFHYRNEQIGINNGFNTVQTSYNQYLNSLHGGIGLNIISDQQGGNTFNSTYVNAMYSFHFKFNKRTKIALAFESSYYQNSFNAENLVFSNMIDNLSGVIFPSTENFTNKDVKFVDFSTGILFYKKKIFAGISVNHLTQFYLQNEQYKLPLKYSLQAGYRFSFDPNDTRKEKFAIMPNIIYLQQQNYQFLTFGFYFIKKKYSFGLWLKQSFYPYITNDAIIFSLNFKIKAMQITYSYEIPSNRLLISSLGNNEISLQFNFKCKEKRDNNTISCPAYEL